MSIEDKLALVQIAEADCAVRRANMSAAWRGFKLEAERAATPRRILATGLIGGFLTGLRDPAGGGGSLGGKFTGMLLNSVVASLSAAMAAGATAATTEHDPYDAPQSDGIPRPTLDET